MGAIVSTKIGGGADLHNMDVYLVLLLLVSLYFILERYTPQSTRKTSLTHLPWPLVMTVLLVPVWFAAVQQGSINSYNILRTRMVINSLQKYVDTANHNGQEILFITQRQLIAFHEIKNAHIVPEYEREELMEMAMSNQKGYLNAFRTDMENQRFAAIIVDPLSYRLLGKNYSFGEENNVWVKRVMKPILCNYQEDIVFSEDQIAIYTPQENKRQCP